MILSFLEWEVLRFRVSQNDKMQMGWKKSTPDIICYLVRKGF